MTRQYIEYDKVSLFEKIDKISIDRVGNQVITKFGNNVISTAKVSKRYEVFDIKSYLRSKIDMIEKNFKISEYFFYVKKGVQELILLSDEVEINEMRFQKSFFILNSSDRSRKLNFNIGLFSKTNNIYIIKNIGLSKKHLNGVTEIAEESIKNINDEVFSEQIDMMRSLVGHKVLLSNIKKIIVNDPDVNVNHMKFDSFKNYFLNRYCLHEDQLKILKAPSKDLNTDNNDFYLDAFSVFYTYMKLFSDQDSHVIRRETEKISEITQFAIRNQILDSLLS